MILFTREQARNMVCHKLVQWHYSSEIKEDGCLTSECMAWVEDKNECGYCGLLTVDDKSWEVATTQNLHSIDVTEYEARIRELKDNLVNTQQTLLDAQATIKTLSYKNGALELMQRYNMEDLNKYQKVLKWASKNLCQHYNGKHLSPEQIEEKACRCYEWNEEEDK